MVEPGNVIVQKEAFEKVGSLLYGLLSSGDERIELTVSSVGPISSPRLRSFNPNGKFSTPDGPANSVFGPFELNQATDELRAACYRKDVGTWFSAKITVTAGGSASAEYNYDQEPDGGDVPIDSGAYLSDLAVFPRAEDKLPDWLKLKLAEARAR